MAKTKIVAKTIENAELTTKAKELVSYKELKAQAEERVKALEAEIKALMESTNADTLICGRFECNLTECERTTFKKDKLEAENPELYDLCLTESKYTRLTVK